MRALLTLTSLLAITACSSSSAGPPQAATSAPAPSASVAPASSIASISSASAATSASAAPAAIANGTPCGALGCRLYDSPAAALRVILEGKPLVLAIGEAHAQKGSEAIASSAKRFTLELLPELKANASDLLVELMAPPSGCKQKTEEVRTKQKVVTEHQAENDQGEYVAMGTAAKKLGIVPDLLRPSCADLDAINKAGEEAVLVSLETIARLTREQAKALLVRNQDRGGEALVVTYGGAMHNDIDPPKDKRTWSYGPDLSAAAKGRYVELDMFVPEFIASTDAWKKFAWYEHFDKSAHPAQVTLFHPAPQSYVMIFAATR